MSHMETSNPAGMVKRGWDKLSLKPGDQMTVTLGPANRPCPSGRATHRPKLSGGFGSLEGGAQAEPNAGAAGGSKSEDYPK
jgi:hypothetical protein